ncbi:MAG: hypothetical protein F6K62_01265 [Sphaerospermopsis sp. SIO1G2]|nr:hypothetical protein [Sphaerospermopsis sp. SIO1G1]NET69717.1 hypothetical protein [Sphaerospermopsis sp. SIO1G2]
MNIQLFKLISLITVLCSVVACNSDSQLQTISGNKVITEDETSVIGTKASQRPPQKTAKMFIEGEETGIDLKLYEEANFLSTYFPAEDFLVETKNSQQQKEISFIVNFGGMKNPNAYLKFVFPQNLKTLSAIREFINSENGLIKNNQWQKVNNSSDIKYSWIQEKIVFRKGRDIVGDIYIGEQNGKVFYVITHLPIEYAEGFAAREDLIFQHLEIGG